MRIIQNTLTFHYSTVIMIVSFKFKANIELHVEMRDKYFVEITKIFKQPQFVITTSLNIQSGHL